MSVIVCFYHHLGLGDHIICNGMVRKFLKCHPEIDRLDLFCRKPYLESVWHMYRDLGPRLALIPVTDAKEVQVTPETMAMFHSYQHRVSVGQFVSGFESDRPDLTWDENFYYEMRMPLETRWADFHYERDPSIEIDPVEMYGGEDYIFLHQDPGRNYLIDTTLVRSDLPVLEPTIELSTNVFSFIPAIRQATEVHCIDSSFRSLIESVFWNDEEFRKKKIVYHQYAKDYYKEIGNIATKLHWETIE